MGETSPVTPANQVYPVGVTGILLAFSTVLLALFLTNLGEGEEATFYFRLGLFYALMGILSIAVIFGTGGFLYDDPRKTADDFLAFLLCLTPFLAIWLTARTDTLNYEQLVLLSLPMPILQLLVASAEEVTFRIALPRLAYTMAGGREFQRWFFAGLLSTLLFSLFHAWAYGLVFSKMLSAFVFGGLQYLTFRVAVLLSGDGATALAGIIGAHWLVNLYFLGEDWLFAAVVYITVMLMILVMVRGYQLKPPRWGFRWTGKRSRSIGW